MSHIILDVKKLLNLEESRSADRYYDKHNLKHTLWLCEKPRQKFLLTNLIIASGELHLWDILPETNNPICIL